MIKFFNKNERKNGEHGFPWSGSLWFYKNNKSFSINYSLHKYLYLGICHILDPQEGSISTSLSLPFLSLSMEIKLFKLVNKLSKLFKIPLGCQRELSINLHNGLLTIYLWCHYDDFEISSRKRRFFFNIRDFFLGKSKYSQNIFENQNVTIPMPEGTYSANIILSEDTWKRKRSPFTLRENRAHIEMLPGQEIPIPGKGEYSWDCGDDAIFGSTFSANSISEAVGKLVQHALETRVKYAGMHKWEWNK